MFLAGPEIALVQFRRRGHRSLAFGLATFALSFAGGILLGLVAAIVVGLIVTRRLAALSTRRAFGYFWCQGFVMWSLTPPQVAATLAAAPVVFEVWNAEG